MSRPTVAIVGRPNVGKSSLFNRLVGQPIAIVDPTPGVTRDRILHEARFEGWRFDVIDTGGIGIVDEAKLEKDVYRQVERAIGTADRIIFLVDGREGILPLDREIAATLRPIRERVILAVNKIDHEGLDHDIHTFLQLGCGEPMGISAAQATGLIDMLDRIGADLPDMKDNDEPPKADDGRLKICLAGRRNVGKSSLTNALCGEERVIVADLPGTTRDAIDVPISDKYGEYTLIDTAGLRKKNQIEEDVEFYAACRTERAILRSQVVLLVLDVSDEVGTVDKKLAHFCEAEGKPTILVLNKWDIAEAAGRTDRDEYLKWLRDRLPGLRYAPAVYTCALTGAHVRECLKMAAELKIEAAGRIPTAEVNKLIEMAVQKRRPRKVGPSPTKIYFGTQAETNPPTFVIFVNRTDWIEPGYSRYLENFIRERVPFQRVPIRILFKSRESRFHENLDEHRMVMGKTKSERNVALIIPRRPKRKGDRA